MIYLIYSKDLVDRGIVPSSYCCATKTPKAGMFKYLDMANFVFELKGNTGKVIKNRYGTLEDFELDDHEVIVLKLKSVLLCP